MVHRGSALGSGGNWGCPKANRTSRWLPTYRAIGRRLSRGTSNCRGLCRWPHSGVYLQIGVRVEYQKQLQDFRNAERVVGHEQRQYVAVG